jgi:hypothetical protein
MVPDGNSSGLQDVRIINSAIGTMGSLKVRLKVAGEFNGDLYGYLRHIENGTTNFCVLLNRTGRSTTNDGGYPDGGFDVTFDSGAANGNVHFYRAITGPLGNLPLTGAWEPDGRAVDPTNVTELSAITTSLASFNNVSAAGEWTLYLADLESGGTNMLREWGLDISGGAYPTLVWSTPADIVYGTALSTASQLNASATFNSTNVPGTFTYNYTAGTMLNAGSNQVLTVTFTPADSAAFLPVSTNVALNVLKAPLTIAANSTNKVYGAALPAFAASYTGLVNGDTTASLTTPVTLSTIATAASPASAYAITASGATSSNYNITFVSGTLTITPAPLTIAANNTNKVYGTALPMFAASYSGFVNGDTVASLGTPVTLGTAATAASPVGSYAITASGAI